MKEADKDVQVLKVIDNDSIESLGYGKDFEMIVQKHYGLMPTEKFEKQYCLLHNLLVLSGKKLLVRFALRQKSHLGIVKTFGKHLVLAQLIYPQYFRKLEEYKEIEIKKEETQLGMKLLNQIGDDKLKITDVTDDYTDTIMKYIQGDIPLPQERKVEKTEDMLALLNASLGEGKSVKQDTTLENPKAK